MASMRSATYALLALSALAHAGWVRADPPGGTYELELGSEAQLSIPDGDGHECVFDAHSTTNQICVDTTGVTTDATGAIAGSTAVVFSFPNLFDANLPGTLAGQLAGSTRAPRAKLLLSASGTGNFHNPESTAAATLTGSLSCKNPFPQTDEYSCSGRIKLCLTTARRSCAGGNAGAVLHALGGSWALDFDLDTDPSGAVTGGATVTLPNSASESFDVSGKYAGKSDSAKLTLRPSAPSKDKLSLGRLAISGGVLQSGQLKFEVAGLKGTAVILPPP